MGGFVNKTPVCDDFILCCGFAPRPGGSGCGAAFQTGVRDSSFKHFTSVLCVPQVTSEDETEDALKGCAHNREYAKAVPLSRSRAFNELALKPRLYELNLEQSLFLHCGI